MRTLPGIRIFIRVLWNFSFVAELDRYRCYENIFASFGASCGQLWITLPRTATAGASIVNSDIDKASPYSAESDQDLLDGLTDRLISRAGSFDALCETVGVIIRTAIDDVIDTPRSGRRDISDLEKTEKTYLGTKVEILFRHALGLRRGRLDLVIDEKDVDVKFTVRNNWMIPSEAVDAPCILLGADEIRGKYRFGLIVARDRHLNEGRNRDGKRSISQRGFSEIKWIANNCDYPQRFWKALDADKVEAIFSVKGGTARLVRLFELVRDTPVNRSVIADVAQQLDYMKRIRENGGARDELKKRKILLLSGKRDSRLIRQLGLPACDKDSFISTDKEPAAED